MLLYLILLSKSSPDFGEGTIVIQWVRVAYSSYYGVEGDEIGRKHTRSWKSNTIRSHIIRTVP